jgi:hypothetical protein
MAQSESLGLTERLQATSIDIWVSMAPAALVPSRSRDISEQGTGKRTMNRGSDVPSADLRLLGVQLSS